MIQKTYRSVVPNVDGQKTERFGYKGKKKEIVGRASSQIFGNKAISSALDSRTRYVRRRINIYVIYSTRQESRVNKCNANANNAQAVSLFAS
jgi:hypothetical protein